MADLGVLTTNIIDAPSERELQTVFALNVTTNPVRIISMFGPTYWDPGSEVFTEDKKVITGNVLNSAGSGIARKVVAYDQTQGLVVDTTISSAVTGAFTLRVPFANKCSVFHIPEQADNRNGVILSNLTPI